MPVEGQGDDRFIARGAHLGADGTDEAGRADDRIGPAGTGDAEAEAADRGVDHPDRHRQTDRQSGQRRRLLGDCPCDRRRLRHRLQEAGEALVAEAVDECGRILSRAHIEVGAAGLGRVGGDGPGEPEADPVLAVELVGRGGDALRCYHCR